MITDHDAVEKIVIDVVRGFKNGVTFKDMLPKVREKNVSAFAAELARHRLVKTGHLRKVVQHNRTVLYVFVKQKVERKKAEGSGVIAGRIPKEYLGYADWGKSNFS